MKHGNLAEAVARFLLATWTQVEPWLCVRDYQAHPMHYMMAACPGQNGTHATVIANYIRLNLTLTAVIIFGAENSLSHCV